MQPKTDPLEEANCSAYTSRASEILATEMISHKNYDLTALQEDEEAEALLFILVSQSRLNERSSSHRNRAFPSTSFLLDLFFLMAYRVCNSQFQYR